MEEGGGAGGRCQTRAGRWGLMNPEKEELKPGEVAKRPAVIITAPLGSLSIRVAVGASDSCGRWRRSRERGGGAFPSGSLSVVFVVCDSQIFSWSRFFNILNSNMKL